QREPRPRLRGQLFQGQPVPVADLDGVGAPVPREEAQDLPLKKGRVHAELQGHGAADARPEALDELAQEGDGLLGVMDVPRTILEAQDVAGLRQMGYERVVAQMLPVMRIEAAEGPLHLGPRAYHGAIDIHRKPGQAEFRDSLDDEVVSELDPRAARGLG